METITLWGRATSSNVQAVMWGLAELGLRTTRIDTGGRHGGTDTAGYRAMNPPGLVPTLRIGDEPPLFESAAILRHLMARYGTPPLWPDDPNARARIDMWAEWAKHSLSRAFIVPVFWAHWRTPDAERDVDAIRAGVRGFETQLEALVAQAGDGWLTDAFSLADIWAGHTLYRYFTLDIDRQTPPGVADYYARLRDRPGFRDHAMIDYADLKAVKRT